MDYDNGKIGFQFIVDNDELKRKVKETENLFSAMGDTAHEEGEKIDSVFRNIGKSIAAMGAAWSAQEFAKKVATTRGEFQQLEMAFTTMLGSSEEANKLMKQMVDLAATTPFDVEGVANGAKQLLAYGVQADEITDTLTRLGDIAAGLSIPLNDIVYLYGTTITQGRMYTMDLRQFMGRGIPLATELAKQFGVTKDKVADLVSEGKVGAEEFKNAIKSMTDEGSQFGGLMDAQSKTITGQISNIEDAIQQMFNELGKRSEGLISDTLSTVSTIVDNWEKIGKAILVVATLYGTYKATVLAVAAAHKLMAIWGEVSAFLSLAKSVTTAKDAMVLLNIATKANPIGLILSVVAAAAAAFALFADKTDKAAAAQNALNGIQTEAAKKAEDTKLKIDTLRAAAQNETLSLKERKNAVEELNRIIPNYNAQIDNTTGKLRESKEALDGYISSLVRQYEVEGAKDKLKDIGRENADLTIQRNRLSKQLKDAQKTQKQIEAVAATSIQGTAGGYSGAAGIAGSVKLDGIEDELDEINQKLKENKRISDEITNAYGTDIQKEAVSEADKTDTDGTQDKKGKKTGETAEERRTKIQKAELDVQKVLEESSKARQQLQHDLAQQEEQNEINLEEDANKRRLRQLELDQAKEQDQLQKQQEQAVNAEIQRQKQYFDAVENERAAKNKKYVKKNFTDADIDQAQIDAINEQYSKLFAQLAEQQQKSRADLVRGDFDAMRDYLKNYGTYQQQKLAIAQEYAKKIQDAQSEGEKRSLEKERDSALAGVETRALKANIDWTTVFSEFGGMFRDVIAPVLEDAKKYIQTDEFKNSDQDSQKALIQAVQQMQEAMGSTGEANFKQLGDDIKAYQAAQERLKAAQQDNEAKTKALTQAQDIYTNAVKNGTEEEQAAAKGRVDAAQKEVDASNENVQGLQEAADQAKQTVTDTATTLKASIDNVIGGLQQLSSNSLSGTYKGLIQFGKGLDAMKDMGKMGDTFGKLSKSLESTPIIGAIAGILDILKDGISDLISGLIDTVFSIVANILDDVLSGDLFKSIGESLLTGINNIFDAITFGGFGSLFGNGDSDKNLERDIERLTEVNSALANAIEELTDAMEDSAMVDAAELYQQQAQLLNESEANTQEMMRRSGAAYSNGTLGIGGKHSSNSKINSGVSNAEWQRISNIVGFDVKSASDFWRLTSEQMREVAIQAPDIYGKIKDLADNGYRNAAQYMDDYIDFAKQREELEEAYYEKLTNLSFDSLRDEFKNALTDMESSAADFANDFNKLLIDSIAEALMTNKYDPKIKALYEKWAKYMENDGKLDEDEIADIQKDRDAIYNSMADDRKFLETLNTSATSQESSKKGFATASQDSIDELNGRFTAVQMDTSAIRETLNSINASMAAMNLSNAAMKQYQDEIRNISLLALDHLESIAKNTHELYEMNERLGKIEKNTRKI